MKERQKDIEKKKTISSHQLSKEILGLFGATTLIAIFVYIFLNAAANSLILNYVDKNEIILTEYQIWDMEFWIQGISFASAVLLFVVLFLFLAGERLAYISEIIKGIDALGCHEWNYEIPLQGENELTELARRVNELSKEEQAFQKREKQIKEEKERLIRALSHDIRTPLTSMMSYSEFMKQKKVLTLEEMKTYMDLVEQKSQQIKLLTDRLLDGGNLHLEVIENGRFLMEQLVDEWASDLEDDFELVINISECPQFSGKFDIQEWRRIFDNLVSNIRKYADEEYPVILEVKEQNGWVCIYQSNKCKRLCVPVESRKIGIDSMRKIASHYGGGVEVSQIDGIFSIRIELVK